MQFKLLTQRLLQLNSHLVIPDEFRGSLFTDC
jgi:hypothetical protein